MQQYTHDYTLVSEAESHLYAAQQLEAHEQPEEAWKHIEDARRKLQQYLASKGIETLIHYPIPPHKQECYKEWNYLSLPVTELIHKQELSLPCNQTMTDEEAEYIADTVNNYT